MKIYLDNCCYNRLLDDRSNLQIYYERNSVMLILELAEKRVLQLVGSEMLAREMEDTPDHYRRVILRTVYSLCREETKITLPVLERAEEIRHASNIRYKDSIHLACAEAAQVDALLTTDRKFAGNCSRIKTYTKVMNPNQWLLEVIY